MRQTVKVRRIKRIRNPPPMLHHRLDSRQSRILRTSDAPVIEQLPSTADGTSLQKRKAMPSVSPRVPGCHSKSNNFPLSLLQSCQHVTPVLSHAYGGQHEPLTLAELSLRRGQAVLFPRFHK